MSDTTAVQADKKETRRRFGKRVFIIVPLLLSLFVIAILVYKPPSTTIKQQAAVPSDAVSQALFLEIDNPVENATAVGGEVLVEGRTLPDITVVLYSDTDESIMESDARGNFKGTLLIGERGGVVRATAFSNNGMEVSRTFLVSETEVLGTADKASGKNKINNLSGTNSNAVDKEASNEGRAQSRAQILKSETTPGGMSDKPQEVSEFLTDRTKKTKPVKLGAERLAEIFSDSSSAAVLKKNINLKKMEVKKASEGAQLKRRAVQGVIVSISGGIITLAHQIQNERTYIVYYNDSTDISVNDKVSSESAKLSELTAGIRIAAVGIPSEKGLLAARIHVISGKVRGVFRNTSTSVTPEIREEKIETTPTISPDN